MKIKITSEFKNAAHNFAYNRVHNDSEGVYKRRGEDDKKKIYDDIMVGLLGEFAVCYLLNDRNIECSEPDMEIYDKKLKSFDADLMTEKFDIHVKSQSSISVEKYGHSWLLQRLDPVVNRPTDRDILAFTHVDIENNCVTIKGFCNATDLKEFDCWKECKHAKYGRTKKALYLENIYNLVREEL